MSSDNLLDEYLSSPDLGDAAKSRDLLERASCATACMPPRRSRPADRAPEKSSLMSSARGVALAAHSRLSASSRAAANAMTADSRPIDCSQSELATRLRSHPAFSEAPPVRQKLGGAGATPGAAAGTWAPTRWREPPLVLRRRRLGRFALAPAARVEKVAIRARPRVRLAANLHVRILGLLVVVVLVLALRSAASLRLLRLGMSRLMMTLRSAPSSPSRRPKQTRL